MFKVDWNIYILKKGDKVIRCWEYQVQRYISKGFEVVGKVNTRKGKN